MSNRIIVHDEKHLFDQDYEFWTGEEQFHHHPNLVTNARIWGEKMTEWNDGQRQQVWWLNTLTPEGDIGRSRVWISGLHCKHFTIGNWQSSLLTRGRIFSCVRLFYE
jgi:hypothetical protein